MIFRNNNKIANIYRGTLKISNVYRGGILVYTGEKSYDGLTFEALEPSTIKYTPSTVSTAQYSYDTVNWQSANNVTLNLNKGDRVFFKGNITGNQTSNNCARFTMTGKISASGSIMSLQAGNPEDTSLKYDYEFYRLFQDCKSLVTATKILPATTLSNYCYKNMFNGCSSLVTPPNLPATTLTVECYTNMFLDCSSLTKAPELPATTLTNNCYQGMFKGCSSLTASPELPATTLVNDCYMYMFWQCTKLNYIKAMFTTKPSSSYTYRWVDEVSSTGTFVKNKNATWNVTGVDGIPRGWTVETA